MNKRYKLINNLNPKVPPQDIVIQLNKIYHKYEAEVYDKQHPEIMDFLPKIWQKMIHLAISATNKDHFRVLDFGCGTGFEAVQIIETIGKSRLNLLVCYDLSPEMLAKCSEKVSKFNVPSRFISSLEFSQLKNFDLIVTNSLLHHLPDWHMVTDKFRDLLVPGGFWINGHEPSVRFYKNTECHSMLNEFHKWRKWRRLFNPKTWKVKVSRRLGITPEIAKLTAAEFNSLALTQTPISEKIIGLLVDFNVPHNEKEAETIGLDPVQMASTLAPDFEQIFLKTYNYMGPFYEGNLPSKWQHKTKQLQEKFPEDGANFCAVWRRKVD